MSGVEECFLDCPYCGEPISLLVDCSVSDQLYTEDCQVCCQPMVIQVWLDEQGSPQVQARREDD